MSLKVEVLNYQDLAVLFNLLAQEGETIELHCPLLGRVPLLSFKYAHPLELLHLVDKSRYPEPLVKELSYSTFKDALFAGGLYEPSNLEEVREKVKVLLVEPSKLSSARAPLLFLDTNALYLAVASNHLQDFLPKLLLAVSERSINSISRNLEKGFSSQLARLLSSKGFSVGRIPCLDARKAEVALHEQKKLESCAYLQKYPSKGERDVDLELLEDIRDNKGFRVALLTCDNNFAACCEAHNVDNIYVDQHPQLSSTLNLFSLTKTIYTLAIYMAAVELCSFPHSFTLLGYWSGETPEDRVQGNLAVLLNPDLPHHHRALQLLARLREVKRALAR